MWSFGRQLVYKKEKYELKIRKVLLRILGTVVQNTFTLRLFKKCNWSYTSRVIINKLLIYAMQISMEYWFKFSSMNLKLFFYKDGFGVK